MDDKRIDAHRPESRQCPRGREGHDERVDTGGLGRRIGPVAVDDGLEMKVEKYISRVSFRISISP